MNESRSAHDRIAAGYVPDWDIDSADGHQTVLFMADTLDALQDGASLEVKRDRQAVQTGNIYLEYRCRISGQWVPSGFDRTNAELFAIAIAPQVVIVAPADAVRAVARRFWAVEKSRRECIVGGNPTKGIVVPVTDFVTALMQSLALSGK